MKDVILGVLAVASVVVVAMIVSNWTQFKAWVSSFFKG